MNKKITLLVLTLSLGALTLTGCSSKVETAKTDTTTSQTATDTTVKGSTNNSSSNSGTTTPVENAYLAADVFDVNSKDPAIKAASELAAWGKARTEMKNPDAMNLEYLNNTFIPAHPEVEIVNPSKTNVSVVYFTSGKYKACTTVTFTTSDITKANIVVLGAKDLDLCKQAEKTFKTPPTK